MIANRSMPACTVIPELAYPDVDRAVDWLCDAFGFTVRLTIANHRAQLHVGDGAVVITELRRRDGRESDSAHAVMVRVDDVDAHHACAVSRGARILNPPATYPYGERQYSVQDTGGHVWTFSQSVADVAPDQWGGTPGELDRGGPA